jgi:cysteinyl-tRNA synthetase
MYNCGPTVYGYTQIGNWRAFLFADLLKRFLKFKGYQVKQVMNITDVGHMTSDADEGEDKLEKGARLENKTPQEIARFYEDAFLKDAASLNIDQADKYPRATEHIPEMIELVKTLLEKGYAYEVNGSVYFDITKFPKYGHLSGNTLSELEAGKRVDINSDKKNPADFALWIYNPKHLMFWQSPWNNHGYPGWHLECSAMSMKYLGEHFDIHTGGEDNKFPHHECEIAQSECATGKKWVNYWLHLKHLLIENKKMSKSLGNFYTLKDLIDKGYTPSAIRYVLIATHYRQQLNFTFKGIEDAQKNIDKLVTLVQVLSHSQGSDNNVESLISQTRQDFTEALDEDLNIAQALAIVFDFVRQINKLNLNQTSASLVREFILSLDLVLGLNIEKLAEHKTTIPTSIQNLVDQRHQAREAKNWQLADEIRTKLDTLGWQVEDTASGQKITKK